MLRNIGEKDLNKQVKIIVWSLVYIFAYTIAVNRNDESLEDKVTGDNIHRTVSKYMKFEPVSKFLNVYNNEDDNSSVRSSDKEFASRTTNTANTASTKVTHKRKDRKNKKDRSCTGNDNSIESVDAKLKEVKANHKSTNNRRNKTCRPDSSNGSTSNGIEDIKMDKNFIINKYIKDINNIDQCESFNPAVEQSTNDCDLSLPSLPPVVTKSSDTKTTNSTIISSDTIVTASSSNNNTDRPILVNIIATTNNNFNSNTEIRTRSVFDYSEKLTDVMSDLFVSNNNMPDEDNGIAVTIAETENFVEYIEIEDNDSVKENGHKLLLSSSAEKHDDCTISQSNGDLISQPNGEFIGQLKIEEVNKSVSENESIINNILIDGDSGDLALVEKKSSKLSISGNEKSVVSILNKR